MAVIIWQDAAVGHLKAIYDYYRENALGGIGTTSHKFAPYIFVPLSLALSICLRRHNIVTT